MKLYLSKAFQQVFLLAGFVVLTMTFRLFAQPLQAQTHRAGLVEPASLLIFRISLMKKVLARNGDVGLAFSESGRWYSQLSVLEQNIRQQGLSGRYSLPPELAMAERHIDSALRGFRTHQAHEQSFNDSFKTLSRLGLNYVEGYLQERFCPERASKLIDKGQTLGSIPSLADLVLGSQDELSGPTLRKPPVSTEVVVTPGAVRVEVDGRQSADTGQLRRNLLESVVSYRKALDDVMEKMAAQSLELQKSESALRVNMGLEGKLKDLYGRREELSKKSQHQEPVLEAARVGIESELDEIKALEKELASYETFISTEQEEVKVKRRRVSQIQTERGKNPQLARFLAELNKRGLDDQLQFALKQRDKLSAQLNKLQHKHRQLEASSSQARENVYRWTLEESAMERAIENHSRKRQSFQAALNKESDVTHFNEKLLGELNGEIELLNKEMSRDRVTELSVRLEALKNELEFEAQELDAMAEKGQKWSYQIIEFGQSDEGSLEDLHKLSEQARRHSEGVVEPLKNQARDVEYQLINEQKRVQEVKEALADKRLEYDRVVDELARSKEKVVQLEQKIKPCDTQIEKTEIILEQHRESKDELFQALDDAEQRLRNEFDGTAEKQLEDELSDASALYRSLIEEKDAANELYESESSVHRNRRQLKTIEEEVSEKREAVKKHQTALDQIDYDQEEDARTARSLEEELSELVYKKERKSLEEVDASLDITSDKLLEVDYQERLKEIKAEQASMGRKIEKLSEGIEQLDQRRVNLMGEIDRSWRTVEQLPAWELTSEEPVRRTAEMDENDWGAGFSKWVTDNTAWIPPVNRALVKGMTAWYAGKTIYYGASVWYQSWQVQSDTTSAEQYLAEALSDESLALYGTCPVQRPPENKSLVVHATANDRPICPAPQVCSIEKGYLPEHLLWRPPAPKFKDDQERESYEDGVCPALPLVKKNTALIVHPEANERPVCLAPQVCPLEKGYLPEFLLWGAPFPGLKMEQKIADDDKKTSPGSGSQSQDEALDSDQESGANMGTGFTQKFDFKAYVNVFSRPTCPAPVTTSTGFSSTSSPDQGKQSAPDKDDSEHEDAGGNKKSGGTSGKKPFSFDDYKASRKWPTCPAPPVTRDSKKPQKKKTDRKFDFEAYVKSFAKPTCPAPPPASRAKTTKKEADQKSADDPDDTSSTPDSQPDSDNVSESDQSDRFARRRDDDRKRRMRMFRRARYHEWLRNQSYGSSDEPSGEQHQETEDDTQTADSQEDSASGNERIVSGGGVESLSEDEAMDDKKSDDIPEEEEPDVAEKEPDKVPDPVEEIVAEDEVDEDVDVAEPEPEDALVDTEMLAMQQWYHQGMQKRMSSMQAMDTVTGLFTLSSLSGVWEACHSLWSQRSMGETFAPDFTYWSGLSYGDVSLAAHDQTGQWYSFLQGNSQSGSFESNRWQGSAFSWGALGFINEGWLAGLMISRQKVSLKSQGEGDSVQSESTQFHLLTSFRHSAWHYDLMVGVSWPVYRYQSGVTGTDNFQTLQWQGYVAAGYRLEPGWFMGEFSLEPRLEVLQIQNAQSRHSLNCGEWGKNCSAGSESQVQVYQLGVTLELKVPGVTRQQSWSVYVGRQQAHGNQALDYDLAGGRYQLNNDRAQTESNVMMASYRQTLGKTVSVGVKVNGQWGAFGSSSGLNLSFTQQF